MRHQTHCCCTLLQGVVAIIMSWFVSPILSGLLAGLLFFLVRFLVLRRKNAYQLTFFLMPPFVFFTVFVNMYFVGRRHCLHVCLTSARLLRPRSCRLCGPST